MITDHLDNRKDFYGKGPEVLAKSVASTVSSAVMPADTIQLMHDIRTRIRTTVRRVMRFYDVGAGEMATVLGVTRSAFYARLQGTTVIKAEELAAVAAYLRVPVEVFFLEPAEAVRVAAALGDDAGPPDVARDVPEQGSTWIDRSLADRAWSAAPALLAG